MRIFLDENLSEHVAEALNLLSKGYFSGIEVFSTKLAIGIGKKDEEIVPPIGEQGGILITRDDDFRRVRATCELCQQYKIGVIFISMPKSYSLHWDMVKLLIEHWQEIVTACTNKKRPFAFRLNTRSGLKEI